MVFFDSVLRSWSYDASEPLKKACSHSVHLQAVMYQCGVYFFAKYWFANGNFLPLNENCMRWRPERTEVQRFPLYKVSPEALDKQTWCKELSREDYQITWPSDILHGNPVISSPFQGLSEACPDRGKCMISASLIPRWPMVQKQTDLICLMTRPTYYFSSNCLIHRCQRGRRYMFLSPQDLLLVTCKYFPKWT